MYRAILFDLDGTLIDTMDLIVACWQHATTVHCGAPVPRERVLPTIGLPLVPALEEYAPGLGDALYATYSEHNQTWHDRLARLVPGTVEMLTTLQQAGIPLGLVTSKRHVTLQMGLDLHGLAPFFAAIIGFEDSERHKPLPDPVFAPAERLASRPTRRPSPTSATRRRIWPARWRRACSRWACHGARRPSRICARPGPTP